MIDSNPLVSIVIPVYNTAKYLDACLQSVISQTYENLEILIINDGSTDDSNLIIANYQRLDSRILYISKPNEGLPLTRKVGVEKATGKYVQHLDSDDILVANAIELLVNRAEETDADIVAAPFFFIYPNGEKKISGNLSFGVLTGKEYFKEILYREAYWCVWANFQRLDIFRKNAIEFVSDISLGEDAILMTQLLLYAERVAAISTPIIYYNQISDSISHNMTLSRYKDFRAYPLWIETYFDKKKILDEYAKEVAWLHIEKTFGCVYWNHLEDVNRDMKRVLQDIIRFPDLLELLSKRKRKVILTYKYSKWLGYLRVVWYKRKRKL